MKSESPEYRFPGLKPFTENDKEIYEGRNTEAVNLYSKILLYKTVVLHADSGTGKSSLIQAGLLPRLKESDENYFPVILQLNEIVQGDSVNLLTDFTLKKIQDNIEDSEITATTITLLDAQPNSFWKYSKILEKAGKKLVLIFDQFENLQTFKPKQANRFIEELYNLVNLKIPSDVFESIQIQLSSIGDEKSDAFNRVNQSYLFLRKPSVAKLLFVIREDKLGVMSLLSDSFPDILKNDFRIEPLSKEFAKNALEIPAAYMARKFESTPFSFEDSTYLINKIANEDTGLVDPVLLQIVASSIEVNQVILEGKASISNKDIPEVSNIVIKHYNDSLDKIRKDLNLSELQISDYKKTILTKFVVNERRTLVNSGSIESVAPDFIKALLDIGLIREIPAENDTLYYQLVHDRMIGPIINDPTITKANLFEKYLKSLKFANKVAIISIVPLLLSWVYIEINYFNFSVHSNKLNTELSASQAKYNALSDSVSVIDSLIINNNTLSKDAVKVQKLYEKKKKDSLTLEEIESGYYRTFKEKESLTKYSTPVLTIILTIVNALLWGLVLFFQFARRISLKYLFKEISIYKAKRKGNDDKIELLFPFWLAPVSKTNFRLLTSVKLLGIFNKAFRPRLLNVTLVLCLLIIVLIQIHITYIGYVFKATNSDDIFYINVLFTLFSVVAATTWFTPLNNKEYGNEKDNSKILSRKDFITFSLYTALTITLYKRLPVLFEHKKQRFTGIKKPRYRVKKPKPQFSLPNNKAQTVINKKSRIIHFVDDKGFSLAFKSIQTDKDFMRFKHNIEIFNQLDHLTINSKPRLSIKYVSWNAENIALNCLKSGNIETAVDILLYSIKQNYNPSLRLNDLLALICIRHKMTVPQDTLNQLINYSAVTNDKKLIARVEKWKNQTWRNKVLNRPKVVFNKTEI